MIDPVTIGRATLYNADCRDILPTLGKVDAVVTDPPYGIDAGRMNLGFSRTSRMEKSAWDSEAPDLAPLLALAVPTIIWGGNYFPLPPCRRFLVWNKGGRFKDRSFSECELAWTNLSGGALEKTYDPQNDGAKEHPTQKPVRIMDWCVGLLHEAVDILDPYMGSGTTGVAAAKAGLDFIGIEREERYFEIACRRIEDAQRQSDLFIEGTAA